MTDIYFLLGGWDLEMKTISEVLDKENIPYSNAGLQWHNANLSQYKDILNNLEGYNYVYGVELNEDIPLPENYVAIDHHTQRYTENSALEQVMAILGKHMDRDQMLVAANDKSYIPGMINMGATAEEIEDIRYRDRQAQGVTQQDEDLAKIAVAENMEIVNELIKVKALSSKFSPICDKLFPYKNLLIYTDAEWVFYGDAMMRIREMFNSEIEKGKIFFGGGAKGYIGAKQGVYSLKELNEMIKNIEEVLRYE